MGSRACGINPRYPRAPTAGESRRRPLCFLSYRGGAIIARVKTTRTPKRTATPAKTRKKAPKAAPRKQPAATKKPGRRADYGAAIDGFFAKQPPHLRSVLELLRKLVEDAAPDATASIKWGMPFFVIGSETMCALAGFRAHVNLILPGPEGTYPDPDGLLEGEGKTGRHLKLRSLDELPRAVVGSWLRKAAQIARENATGS
jgi:hypothetical protein